MSKGSEMFSDATLVQFVDGQIDPETRRKILEVSSQDKTLAARLDVLARGTPAFDGVSKHLLQTMPQGMEENIRSMAAKTRGATAAPDVSRRWFVGGSAVAASLALGAVAGGLLVKTASTSTDWREAVAQYHGLYGKATTERLSPSPADRDRDLQIVSEALGRSLMGIEKAVPDLHFKRAQVLEFEASALIQIVFETASKVPLAFCLKKSRLTKRPIDAGIWNKMALAAWTRDGIDELVVARLPEEQILILAKQLANRML
ncbi:MAG: hypothetical protein ACRCWF_10430 [Beijerinckiaceae bacterium]